MVWVTVPVNVPDPVEEETCALLEPGGVTESIRRLNVVPADNMGDDCAVFGTVLNDEVEMFPLWVLVEAVAVFVAVTPTFALEISVVPIVMPAP